MKWRDDIESAKLIEEHMSWLNGLMPSEKIKMYEKDFSDSPIHNFYLNKLKMTGDFEEDLFKKLWKLLIKTSLSKRSEVLSELSKLLLFIEK